MNQWIATSPSAIKQEAGSDEPLSTDVTNKSRSDALTLLEQLDLLPAILDLMEGVVAGKISPKDIHNNAGSIRTKIANAKRAVEECTDLNKSIVDKKKELAIMKEKRLRKVKLLKRFQNVMNIDVGQSADSAQDASTKNLDVKTSNGNMDSADPIDIDMEMANAMSQETELPLEVEPVNLDVDMDMNE